jgi:hypothetical protein
MIRGLAHRYLLVLAPFLLVIPPSLQGQEPVEPPPVDTTALAFEREVFSYPEYERRNPFRTLLADEGGGPRFERLLLLGIVYSSDESQSVAVLAEGTRTVTPGELGVADAVTVEVTGGTYQVRVGDVVGNVTIMRIDRGEIAIEVEEFGISDSRIMELPRNTAGQGGP